MYSIEAIIGNTVIINQIADILKNTTIKIAINEDVSMLPFAIEAYDSINKDEEVFLIKGFSKLSDKLYRILLLLSKMGKIGYMEADYFAGEGSQCVIAFNESLVVFQEIHKDESINKLLKYLGIVSENNKDEIDTIELGRCRTSEQWCKN